MFEFPTDNKLPDIFQGVSVQFLQKEIEKKILFNDFSTAKYVHEIF